jgi:hypothetical protein
MESSSSIVQTSPTSGRTGSAQAQGGIIETLIAAARRQETLIDLLAQAVECGDETAILLAARNLAANRQREKQKPSCLPGRRKKPTN